MKYGEYIQNCDMKYNMLTVAFHHLFINLRCCNNNNNVTYTKDGWHDTSTKDIRKGDRTVKQNQEGIRSIVIMLYGFC